MSSFFASLLSPVGPLMNVTGISFLLGQGTASSIAATYSKDDPREQKDSVERKNLMPVSTEDGTELRALRKPVPAAGTLLPAEPSIPGRTSLRVIRCWQRGHFMQHVRGVR